MKGLLTFDPHQFELHNVEKTTRCETSSVALDFFKSIDGCTGYSVKSLFWGRPIGKVYVGILL